MPPYDLVFQQTGGGRRIQIIGVEIPTPHHQWAQRAFRDEREESAGSVVRSTDASYRFP